jgi:ABC-type transport system involved in multi-copper enzyme maturation permease subunit
LRKWPAVWVLIGAWLLLNLTFGYVLNYVAYATGSSNFATEGVSTESLLADLLPAAIPHLLTDGMPLFGAAIMMILGGLAAGGGYGWGTWKTALTQGPGRLTAFAGTWITLAGLVVGLVAATFAFDLASSTLIALAESQSLDWPNAGDMALSMGGGVLIMGMWMTAGVMIGVLTRSPALSTGLGLIWALVVENLLRGVASSLDGLAYVTDVLPGTASGSIPRALGAATAGEGAAPGVLTTLDGTAAALLLTMYTVVFVVVSAVTMRRRDVA